MKNSIFFYILTIFSFMHSSDHSKKHIIWQTEPRSNHTLNQTPKHLQNLFEIYKELEHQYALNLFYSEPYKVQPEERSLQVILKNIQQWNGFIRSRLKNKSNFNEEEIDIIQRLQIHQKEAAFLIGIYKTMNYILIKHLDEITGILRLEENQRLKLSTQKKKELDNILTKKSTEFKEILQGENKFINNDNEELQTLSSQTKKMIEMYLDSCHRQKKPDFELGHTDQT